MEGTILKMRPRGTDLHLETVVGVPEMAFAVASPLPPHARSTTVVGGTSAARELPSPSSAPSGPFQQAHAFQLVATIDDRRWPCLQEEERETGNRERNRVEGVERKTWCWRKRERRGERSH